MMATIMTGVKGVTVFVDDIVVHVSLKKSIIAGQGHN